jgi:hypothetical protein
LRVRLSGKPKHEVCREVCRELTTTARQALEQAVRDGAPVPTWQHEKITQAGYGYYCYLCHQAGQQPHPAPALAPSQGDERSRRSGQPERQVGAIVGEVVTSTPASASSPASGQPTEQLAQHPPLPTSDQAEQSPRRNLIEELWAVGKQHGYPGLPDLDLQAGKSGWNWFSLAHRDRIPEVLARLQEEP